jgi:tRNA threonylcarbamoyladenosine biosynthesis protein TsaE
MAGAPHESTINIYTELQFTAGIALKKLSLPVSLRPMELRFTLDGIKEAARQFWQAGAGARVFALHGEMGAGKTTFVHALCDVKGVSSTVGSPTFSIINEYVWPGGTIYHIDLYRLNNEEEAIRAGVEDCLYSGNICLVEWPERAEAIFPDDTIAVYLQAIDPQTRLLRIGDK